MAENKISSNKMNVYFCILTTKLALSICTVDEHLVAMTFNYRILKILNTYVFHKKSVLDRSISDHCSHVIITSGTVFHAPIIISMYKIEFWKYFLLCSPNHHLILGTESSPKLNMKIATHVYVNVIWNGCNCCHSWVFPCIPQYWNVIKQY